MTLILSLFPGLDVLGMGFEREGFCVVAGPDVVWGRDIRDFHPARGRFDGIIGGPPCQTFSTLANLVRAKGLEPRFGNLIPEFVRCVEEATPRWFLMENVVGVPEDCWPRPDGYSVTTFVIDNSWLDAGNGFGHEQMRKRRFWFGWPGPDGAPDLGKRMRFACLELPRRVGGVVAGHGEAPGTRDRLRRSSVLADARETPVRLGGSGKVKKTAVCAGHDDKIASGFVVEAARRKRVSAVTGAHQCSHRPKGGHGERYSLEEMLRLQGLEPEILDHAPFTVQGKRKLVGNAVPLGMARELARAVKEVL